MTFDISTIFGNDLSPTMAFGSENAATMRVQVTLRAEKLKNTGRRPFQVADPYASLQFCGGPLNGKDIGRTETLQNTLNPVWTTILFVDIDAGTYMPFRVSIYDDNGNSKDKLMAEATFEMTGVYQSPGNTQVQELDGNGICVSVEESVRGDSNGTFDLHIRGLQLKNVESGPLGLGRSDPFYELSKKNADYEKGIVRWNPVYRSESITDNLNPFFAAQPPMSLEALCYCDLEWPLRITIFDWERNGKHKLIGQFDTNANELKSRVSIHGNADRDRAYELVKEGKDSSRGLVVILRANVNPT